MDPAPRTTSGPAAALRLFRPEQAVGHGHEPLVADAEAALGYQHRARRLERDPAPWQIARVDQGTERLGDHPQKLARSRVPDPSGAVVAGSEDMRLIG